ncbi:glutamate--tRNA ligase [Undibacterium sp. RTI2.1]|uniref:glutamate--tRNA ligase n=1 Tax=unclassified Undibacterium TaxID=2630295 RepID=UPI002AB49812|nr:MULTISPECIES: glutamate--tRNA ligase [unclassified Undibacterium]MDY7537022.1 glutamate--tRNA ligase [Undibacterium sp. 5I1]MEB0030441.1 glutamate--tRNA ligase [Undibacterium sp. RTI2.1]MEB0115224.1 glutamate--tRNA ligase [Undibacterium sp. RTI2.2]MEB0232860.1 glutamate--tRNA ligase [Undibacterium sp. 10I3]MEB0256252.1 glutamate--tRNA ligase [Undibacterium sp. 5I1]
MSTSASVDLSKPVRTRFAPSPTGYLHVGGARTALFSWAFARHFGGTFVLRIEDTDLERSTPEAVQAILDGMNWLGLQHDEGPFYQMKRMGRYSEVLAKMLADGTAYSCYSSPEEVEAMRELQRANGDKPRYDGTWRPEPGKNLPAIPADRKPVIRFKNPLDGEVSWLDVVKGQITIGNRELDDLVIARPDGTPTYNFCVAVDDWDMQITHVIRGDDHVNNTPRQINILNALGASLPHYGHVPMILGTDGQKLSKRRDAVSVMDYLDKGYLPEAMLNYLARLGWSHGDDEVFSMEQMCSWFDLNHLSSSPAQFNPEKLAWINNHYIKAADNARLAELVRAQMRNDGAQFENAPELSAVVALMKERANTTNELAQAAMLFYRQPNPDAELCKQHITEGVLPALAHYAAACKTVEWSKPALSSMMKETLAQYSLKMPQLAMPLRLLLTGQLQTPSIDAVVELFGRDVVLQRLNSICK